MAGRFITALPVFNERKHLNEVLDQVVRYSDDVLVVNDGSTDGTTEVLAERGDVKVVTHEVNRGYGAALKTAFAYAAEQQYDLVVTIDCDGQHSPQRIPQFISEISQTGADIVSGSRYLETFSGDSRPPEQRRMINLQITNQLNSRLGFHLTDAFCGFKAYRVDAVRRMTLLEDGYAMPLELWVQAACLQLNITELAVPLIYLDEARSFGGTLDDAEIRIAYYQQVIEKAVRALPADCSKLLAS
jgi:dolichol-phosphate mannosyltransferase